MKMKKTFRNTFVAGLFIILPVLVSIWVIHLLFSIIDRSLTPMVLQVIRWVGLGAWSEMAWLNYLAPLVSVTLAVVIISLAGLLGGNVLGRQVLRGMDWLVKQVPIVRGIYSATRQFIDTFSNAKGNAFRRVVLVQFPHPGLWMIGFVTSETRSEVHRHVGDSAIAVFLPTTPNPTSGWLVYLPAKEVISLQMSVDEAFKVIISGGVLTPGDLAAPSKAAPGATPSSSAA
jgi:uncharacterized membrane protein